MEMVETLQKFIKAERTGNWPLKLESTQDMCEFLAAAGRNSYTKSLLLHLQQMTTLEIHHPEVYHQFKNGYHSIWRSEREWAGLSPDYVIESVLMRSLKTSGGLTRGRGMSEQQRAIWTLSMPACASVNSSMQELTGVQRATGEQNQELSQSRTSRDWKDTFTLIEYLKDRNPFDCGEKLCNISNGVHAQAAVNVDESKMIGSRIIAKMEGLQPSEHTFKRKDQAVSMASKVAVKINGEKNIVLPQRLFQRLAIAASAVSAEPQTSGSTAETAPSTSTSTALPSLLPTTFTYELTTYPTALL